MPAEEIAGGLEKRREGRFTEMLREMKLHRDGFSAEHLKWIRDDPEICKLSVGRDNLTLLLFAANYDCAKMLEELLATGACDARAIDRDGYSALMFAAMAENEVVSERMVRALIPHCSMKGRAAEETRNGIQDIHFAMRDGNLKVAKLLAEARGCGDLSIGGPLSTDSCGKNWLRLALASRSQGEALAWVLSLPSARLMLNSGDDKGRTPWGLASELANHWPEALEQLRAARAMWERDDLLRDASICGSVGRKGLGRL